MPTKKLVSYKEIVSEKDRLLRENKLLQSRLNESTQMQGEAEEIARNQTAIEFIEMLARSLNPEFIACNKIVASALIDDLRDSIARIKRENRVVWGRTFSPELRPVMKPMKPGDLLSVYQQVIELLKEKEPEKEKPKETT